MIKGLCSSHELETHSELWGEVVLKFSQRVITQIPSPFIQNKELYITTFKLNQGWSSSLRLVIPKLDGLRELRLSQYRVNPYQSMGQVGISRRGIYEH